MRRDHHAPLLGVVRDAQQLGETARARCESNCTKRIAPRIDEVADRVAVPFALTSARAVSATRPQDARSRPAADTRCSGALQPQDVVRRHRLGEADAAGDVVWRVHVQHQLDARTDCLRTQRMRVTSSAKDNAPVFSFTAR